MQDENSDRKRENAHVLTCRSHYSQDSAQGHYLQN